MVQNFEFDPDTGQRVIRTDDDEDVNAPPSESNNITNALLVKCMDCGNEVSRRAESCPKCGAPIAEASPQEHYKIVKKNKFVGAGFFVQLLGIILLFYFPVGTVIGIILIIAGQGMYSKLVCGNCSNPVDNDKVKLCPSCNVTLNGVDTLGTSVLAWSFLIVIILIAIVSVAQR